MTDINFEIAQKVQDNLEAYGLLWRSAPIFEIRRVMADKGIKNIDLAERLGVTEANVSRMLRGDQNTKIETLHLLAAAIEERLVIDIAPRAKPFLASSYSTSSLSQSFEEEVPVDSTRQWKSFAKQALISSSFSDAGNDETYHTGVVIDEVCADFG